MSIISGVKPDNGVVTVIVVSSTTVPVTEPYWPNCTLISLVWLNPVDFVAYFMTSLSSSLNATCITPFESIIIEFPLPTSPVVEIKLLSQEAVVELCTAYFKSQPAQELYTIWGVPEESRAIDGSRPVCPDDSTMVVVHWLLGAPVE